MRPYLAIGVFALAVVVAACGGGGSSPLPAPKAAPTPMQMTHAAFTLKIPPQASSGSQLRRPAYVSPNTKSVAVIVVPQTSATALPPQVFPVATPSPCATAPGGGESCTFNVQVPYGAMSLEVATFAVPSPGPSSVPLSTFETGTFTVAAGSTPPPLSFTLTGNVASVNLAMQNPDPGIATSTQLQSVGTPFTAPNTLSITPLDASGAPILTDAFESPITVTLSPANAGVSFALTGSQCSPASSAGGSSATIACAKDLNKLTYSYDGTVARDSAKNVVDRITFSAQPQASLSAQPATLALTEATIPLALPIVVGNPYPLQFVPRGDGTFYYLTGASANAAFGSLDPSNPASSQIATLGFVAAGIALDHFGDIWIGVNNNGSGNSLQCFTGVSSTAANAISLPSGMAPFALTTDGNGNVWYYGMDANSASWAGYFTPGAGCATSGPMPNPIQFSTISDYPEAAVAEPGSIDPTAVFLLSNSNGSIYKVTEAQAGSVVASPAATPPGSYFGQALAIDGTGNLYASLPPYTAPAAILAQLTPGGAMNAATLEPGANVGGLDVFPSNGAATRLAYGDGSGLATLDFAANFAASNLQIVPIPTNSYNTAFFDSNGDPWMSYADSTGTLNVAHVIRTSVWTIADADLSVSLSGGTANVNISETGDSGPFTITTSDASVATPQTPYPGIDHLLPLQFSSTGSSVTVTVTDAHGRSQTKTLSIVRYSPAARRRNVARGLTRSKRAW